jgi:hypothetical protein
MADRHTRIKGTQIHADTVEPSDLKATNSPSDTLVPSYDVATGQFTWIVAGGGQTAETTPTEDSGISVQEALNTLEIDKHSASGQFNQAIAAEISGLTAKTTPVDADVTLIEDSATSPTAFLKKKLTWAQIKATLKTYFDGLYQAIGTYLSNIVEDTTPQLGGDLDLNGKNIDFPTTANISDCLDEDNMVSNSATKLATQQSIKAYADTKVKNDGSVNPTNLLTNGDFEFWSLGTALAPDGWTVANGTVAREAVIIKSGVYSAALTRAGAGTTFNQAFYAKKGLTYWKSRTVTFGCWVYATVASRAKIGVNDGVAEFFSSYHSGNSTWEWLKVTYTINANAVSPVAIVAIDTGDTTIYLDGAMCVEGESSFAFSDSPLTTGVVNQQIFTTAGANTWVKPPKGTMALIQVWGGGASGGMGASNTPCGGGGGGAYNEIWIPLAVLGATVVATVAAGGASKAGAGAGNNGGNSTFGSWLTAYGGGGGGSHSSGGGGGGGGGGGSAGASATTSQTGGNGGTGLEAAGGAGSGSGAGGASILGGGGGGYGDSTGYVGGLSVKGGGGGGGGKDTSGAGTNAGGASTMGGGGGGGASTGTAGGAGGVSGYGGSGSAGTADANGSIAGTAPGGGSGGTEGGASGKGGDGQIIVTVF